MSKITSIHYCDGSLCWDAGQPLATQHQYESSDRNIGSVFEAIEPQEIVELVEGVFILDEDVDLIPHPNPYTVILESALAYGKSQHPDAAIQHHAAFANSVAYLMTGASGGYGGPSCREHAASWALAGRDGINAQAETSMGALTIQYPDGSLPRAGKWEYEKALGFAEPICYGALTKLHYDCYRNEHCFDDSAEDIETIKKFLEAIASP